MGDFAALGDLIGSLIGAFLGFMGAYLIFWLEQRKQRVREEQRLRDLFEDVTHILERANADWLDSSERYKALSRSYASAPWQLHMRPISVNPAHLTLERLDRLALLESFRHVLGRKEGRKGWNELMGLIDTMTGHRLLREAAMLLTMEDFNRYGEEFDRYCQELRYTLLDQYEQLPRDTPLAKDMRKILEATQNAGYVTADKLHALIIGPALQLVKDHSMERLERTACLSLVARANPPYGRIKENSKLLSTEAMRFGNEIDEHIKPAPSLIARMKSV